MELDILPAWHVLKLNSPAPCAIVANSSRVSASRHPAYVIFVVFPRQLKGPRNLLAANQK